MKKLLLLFTIFGMLGMPFLASAFPYQLNLTSGIITDLNESNNATGNFTIYIIPQNYTYLIVYNNTYISQNITNITCINCSYPDLRNYTYLENYTYIYFNTSWEYVYNKSEIDNKFSAIQQENSSAEIAALNTRLDNLNITAITEAANKKNSNTFLWVMLGLVGFMALIALVLGVMGIMNS